MNSSDRCAALFVAAGPCVFALPLLWSPLSDKGTLGGMPVKFPYRIVCYFYERME